MELKPSVWWSNYSKVFVALTYLSQTFHQQVTPSYPCLHYCTHPKEHGNDNVVRLYAQVSNMNTRLGEN